MNNDARAGSGRGIVAAVAGCDRVFGLNGVPPVPPDAAPGAYVPDAIDPTVPLLAVPALFPADAPGELGAYLYEGAGHGSQDPIPIFVDSVGAADIVSVRVPTELGDGWQVCGKAVTGESELLVTAPCTRGATALAFTVVVPVSTSAGPNDTVSPLVVIVRRARLSPGRCSRRTRRKTTCPRCA